MCYNVLGEQLLSSFLQEHLEQMCLRLVACRGSQGLLGLLAVHTCLAFSVVDAVNSMAF